MILNDIMLPGSIFNSVFLFRKVLERMTKRGRGNARRSAQPMDAEEAMQDARAEVEDVAAAVETGESSAAAAGAPAAVLQRRLEKAKAQADQAKSDADKAIKEKEAMQKQMRAALALAKSNVGDVVQVAENPVATPARKVCLAPLETGFDLALNLDVCVINLIQIFRRGRKRWQLRRWLQFGVYPFLRMAASSLSSQVLARL